MELKRIQEQLVELNSRLAALRQDTELSATEIKETGVLQVRKLLSILLTVCGITWIIEAISPMARLALNSDVPCFLPPPLPYCPVTHTEKNCIP